jgi:hypothetical protein
MTHLLRITSIVHNLCEASQLVGEAHDGKRHAKIVKNHHRAPWMHRNEKARGPRKAW